MIGSSQRSRMRKMGGTSSEKSNNSFSLAIVLCREGGWRVRGVEGVRGGGSEVYTVIPVSLQRASYWK